MAASANLSGRVSWAGPTGSTFSPKLKVIVPTATVKTYRIR